jgi:hypothetical protein
VGTIIQDKPQRHPESQPRWERLARADRFAQDRAWRTQGLSERQAATELTVPRTPLQAWRMWHDPLARCPHVADFLQSGPGLAFFHRIVLACHLVCVAGGACGMRLVWLFRNVPGLDRCIAASSGAQQQGNRHGEQAMGTSHHDAPGRLANGMPPQDRTVTQDDPLTGGLCRSTMDPESTLILVEQRAQARAQPPWEARMAPALAQRQGGVIPSTSDAAPGRLASVDHSLEAHHAPDGFPVQHELVQAGSGPLATQARAAHQAVTEALAQLERVQTHQQSAGAEPAQRGPGRPPQAPVSLEHAAQAREATRREPERLAQQREPSAQRIRGIGHADHWVARERGVRRNGQRIAAALQGHIAPVRAMAQHAGLSQRCWERSEKAERVVPHRHATIACVSGYVGQPIHPLDLTPPASCARHAKLIPSSSLDRVAQTRPVRDGTPLRQRAARLRAPWCEPGGVLRAVNPEAHDQLHDEAQRLAAVCQRSRAHVEGRNGSVSRRTHPRRGLDLPRQRECFTAMHHFFLTRPDGTTAAERLFGQKPRSMVAAILGAVNVPPAPLRPPRRAQGEAEKASSGRSPDRGQKISPRRTFFFIRGGCWMVSG